MWKHFTIVVGRDLRIAFRNPGDFLNPLMFFVIITCLFPLGIGSSPQQLAEVAPGIVWVTALLSTLLGLEGLFKQDFEDGSLEQLCLAPTPLSLLAFGKITAHWLIYGLPIVIMSPLIGVLLHLDSQAFVTLVLSLLLGTPSLSLIGAIGVGLTAGLRRGGVLLTLLILPLYIPILIFGASAIQSAALGFDATGQLYILSSLLVLSLITTPFATAAAIRITIN
jgi:heme exporter protein B